MMDFEKVFESLPGGGWLSKDEALLLWDAVNSAKGAILEVGCYQGRSTCLLAATERWVITVDPFDGFDDDLTGDQVCELFYDNMCARDLRNVLQIRSRIEEVNAETLMVFGYIGFTYLDGDHTYEGTKSQIIKAMVVKALGNLDRNNYKMTIAVHDVNDSGGGAEVKRAALELLGPWNRRVERLAVWELP